MIFIKNALMINTKLDYDMIILILILKQLNFLLLNKLLQILYLLRKKNY